MPGEPAQWLEVTLPSQRSLEKMVTWTAWTVLVLILAGVLLLFWAMPIHRDLDVVRNATLRMAQGDLMSGCACRASPASATSARASTIWPSASPRWSTTSAA